MDQITSPDMTLGLPRISSENLNESSGSFLSAYLNTIDVGLNDTDSDDDEDELKKAMQEALNYNPKPVDVNINIMNYWEEKKYSYPYLYEVAKIVNSVPASQVSVERSFSALKLVLTDLRSNLSSDSIQKILLLKLNKN